MVIESKSSRADGEMSIITSQSMSQEAEISKDGDHGNVEHVSCTEVVPRPDNPVLTPISHLSESAAVPSARSKSTKSKDAYFKSLVVIPEYLATAMMEAVESGDAASGEGVATVEQEAPVKPILVFINSKSGGRLGPALEKMLCDLIGRVQVFDLSNRSPGDVLRFGLGCLEKLAMSGDQVARKTRNNVRIMVAGGDGSVGWVLASIAKMGLNENFSVPPVGVIPLGTGNDLSRSFRWGATFTSASRSALKRWLLKATEASVAPLDSWQVVIKPAPTLADVELKLPYAIHCQNDIPPDGDPKMTQYFEGRFWNYFSLGMDAQVAYGFHHLRDEKPWLARGPVSNQMIYSGYGCAQGWFCTTCSASPHARGLRRLVRLSIKRTDNGNADWEEVPIPAGIRAIVVLNLQSYAGGRNPWGRPSSRRLKKNGFVEAKVDDGLLEVVGLRDGWHTAFVMISVQTAIRLCQAKALRLELYGERPKVYMQVDGEPWQQPLSSENEPPSVVEIELAGPSLMLSRK